MVDDVCCFPQASWLIKQCPLEHSGTEILMGDKWKIVDKLGSNLVNTKLNMTCPIQSSPAAIIMLSSIAFAFESSSLWSRSSSRLRVFASCQINKLSQGDQLMSVKVMAIGLHFVAPQWESCTEIGYKRLLSPFMSFSYISFALVSTPHVYPRSTKLALYLILAECNVWPISPDFACSDLNQEHMMPS